MTTALTFLLVVLAACANAQPQAIDPAAIDAVLSTEPDHPAAGVEVSLKAEFTGASLPDSSGMAFEVRVDGEPVYVDAESSGGNAFSGKYTFPKEGEYDVFLHLYTEDIHVTKKKQVKVQ